jgi:hypothetical protein
MSTTEKPDYLVTAERIVAAAPKAVRDETTIEAGGGKYSLVKYRGRTLLSVRSKNVRVTVSHDGSAAAARKLTVLFAEAAESVPVKEPKPTAEEKAAAKAEKEATKEAAAAEKAASAKDGEGK